MRKRVILIHREERRRGRLMGVKHIWRVWAALSAFWAVGSLAAAGIRL